MITTEDNTAPIITCPADLTISCEADTSATVRGFATATDNCDPAGGIEIILRTASWQVPVRMRNLSTGSGRLRTAVAMRVGTRSGSPLKTIQHQ
ncbi:MAG: hypothetical protein IPK61_07965 [Saprospiraceae bacterium]|nr:hypothetical protein [Saprospiraceae bacterium]